MLTLGVPKEIKPLEKRAGLTPEAAAEIVSMGVKVLVQAGTGVSSGFLDDDYKNAGASIVNTAQEVYAYADVIQKVKEPQESELPFLKKEQIIFSYLHLASPENCSLVKTLVQKKITAFAYETLQSGGRLPLLAPMSEIAGALSVAYAAFFAHMENTSDLTAELAAIAEKYPTWTKLLLPGKVVIWGGGVAGQSALTTALKLGAQVTVIEKDMTRHAALKKLGADVFNPQNDYRQALLDADIFVGCVHVRGARALRVLTPEQLQQASTVKKKIIMDISIDQGGNFPDSRATTYAAPVYKDLYGNLRFCVANIPSLCGRAATQALSREVLPWTEKILVSRAAWTNSEELRGAVNVHDGKIMLPAVAEAHKL